ncbi:MAG: GTP pyrophosphokinase [Chitinophagaceae bacterium]
MSSKAIENKSTEERKKILTEKAIRFFDIYGEEINLIKQLVDIKLNQIALAYTQKNNIPKESVKITTRVKSLKSFLKKLEKTDWKNFNYLTEIAADLIGARIVCWFLNDRYGVFDYIQSSQQFKVHKNTVKDYIKTPKQSGYRSIHLLTDVCYDRLNNGKKGTFLSAYDIPCEIQIRTKIQDVFGDLTHEFHYKEGQEFSKAFKKIEEILANQANRLALEDNAFMILRDIFMEANQTIHSNKEGITDKN